MSTSFIIFRLLLSDWFKEQRNIYLKECAFLWGSFPLHYIYWTYFHHWTTKSVKSVFSSKCGWSLLWFEHCCTKLWFITSGCHTTSRNYSTWATKSNLCHTSTSTFFTIVQFPNKWGNTSSPCSYQAINKTQKTTNILAGLPQQLNSLCYYIIIILHS